MFEQSNFEEIKNYFLNSDIKVLAIDYAESLKDVKKGDFIYLDPPYDTPDDKDSFTSYTKENFNKESQKQLANVFKELSNKGAYVMLSNHNTELIKELYKDFKITEVKAKRVINSNGQKRGLVSEVIITNY
ncbi:DNA adenine methylase [Mycoplasmopsis adleri]|uniref:DNA adenine methylase n=1 Tax=Mycoplasmopsis adleri TaxID=51362 RepID=UPI003872D698